MDKVEEEEEGKNQKYIDFYLEYIRDTRKSWNDQDLSINQQHAYLGVASELGALVDCYRTKSMFILVRKCLLTITLSPKPTLDSNPHPLNTNTNTNRRRAWI